VEDATIADLARVPSVELVRSYLARIEAIDRSGPRLRAVIETNPDALAIAAKLDEERRGGRIRGPLHGIPILVKDNIDTGDRMQTTAGSLALAGPPAPRDAHVVARLRAAGAVVLGKTNLSEWANIRSDRSSSGWSARGGQTKNPYVLDRSPSGSSSGSAAACAASLTAAAIGTETVGSIVSPASACGIVGLKPTVGLASRSGIVPISHSFDTAGPMTRTVADAALVLAAMIGTDPRDEATKDSRFVAPTLDGDARGIRIGVLRGQPWLSAEQSALHEAAIESLRSLGAILIEKVEMKPVPQLWDRIEEVLLHELVTDLGAYLVERRGAMRSLADVVRFDAAHASEELRWFGQDTFEKALQTADTPGYADALATCRRAARADGIDAAIAAHKLDALVAPTATPAWTVDHVNGDHFGGGSAMLPAIAGYPHLTVPCGFVHELPVGISFFAGAWSEATLLRIGHAFEQATKHRRPPRFIPTLPS
jgi:amidase